MAWYLRSPFRNQTGLVARDSDALSSLHREINRAFDDLWSIGSNGSVGRSVAGLFGGERLDLDVHEDEKAYQITADLPGLKEDEVELTYEDGVLTLRGEKKIERDETKGTWHLTERTTGHFMRQVNLPSNIDSEKISAKFDKGVLSVTLPKIPEAESKAKRIAITSKS